LRAAPVFSPLSASVRERVTVLAWAGEVIIASSENIMRLQEKQSGTDSMMKRYRSKPAKAGLLGSFA
jgi:hypothetical protein